MEGAWCVLGQQVGRWLPGPTLAHPPPCSPCMPVPIAPAYVARHSSDPQGVLQCCPRSISQRACEGWPNSDCSARAARTTGLPPCHPAHQQERAWEPCMAWLAPPCHKDHACPMACPWIFWSWEGPGLALEWVRDADFRSCQFAGLHARPAPAPMHKQLPLALGWPAGTRSALQPLTAASHCMRLYWPPCPRMCLPGLFRTHCIALFLQLPDLTTYHRPPPLAWAVSVHGPLKAVCPRSHCCARRIVHAGCTTLARGAAPSARTSWVGATQSAALVDQPGVSGWRWSAWEARE